MKGSLPNTINWWNSGEDRDSGFVRANKNGACWGFLWYLLCRTLTIKGWRHKKHHGAFGKSQSGFRLRGIVAARMQAKKKINLSWVN